jgi:hypothetical protein
MSYKVQILYFRDNVPTRTIYTGLTEAEAQAICGSPEGSSKTCTRAYLKRRTAQRGPWFLAYTKE